MRYEKGAYVIEQPHGGLLQNYEKGRAHRFASLASAQYVADKYNGDPVDPRTPPVDVRTVPQEEPQAERDEDEIPF